MPATLTVHDHRREPDGSFRLVVLVAGADVAAFAGIAAEVEQQGDDVLVTVSWAGDAAVQAQLIETRRLIDAALEPPAAPVALAEPGTEL